MRGGLVRGYFLELNKSILVIMEHNVQWASNFFSGMGLKGVTWSQYLGGCIGEEVDYGTWLGEKVLYLERAANKLVGVECWKPQVAYNRTQNPLKHTTTPIMGT